MDIMDNDDREAQVLTILFFCNLVIIGLSPLMGIMGVVLALFIMVPIDILYYFLFRKKD